MTHKYHSGNLSIFKPGLTRDELQLKQRRPRSFPAISDSGGSIWTNILIPWSTRLVSMLPVILLLPHQTAYTPGAPGSLEGYNLSSEAIQVVCYSHASNVDKQSDHILKRALAYGEGLCP